MTCKKCDYVMAPFETSCPRCGTIHGQAQTEISQDAKTQFLVPIGHCQNCSWMLFPTDTVCSACGAPVGFSGSKPASRPTPKPAPKQRERPAENEDEFPSITTLEKRQKNKKIATNLFFGVLILVVLGVLFYLWKHGS